MATGKRPIADAAVTGVHKPARIPLARGIVGSIAFVTLLVGTLLPPAASASPALLGAIIALPLIVSRIGSSLPRIHPVLGFVAVLFFALAAQPILDPPDSLYASSKFASLVTLTLLSAFAPAIFRDPDDLVILTKVWVAMAVLLAIITLAGGVNSGGRADALDTNPIWLARALTAGTIMLVWLRWQRRVPIVIFLTLILALMAAIVYTGSRGPLLGLMLGLICLATVGTRARASRLIGLLAVAALGTTVVLLLASDRFVRIANVFDRSVDQSTDQRLTMWTLSLDMIAAYPSGIGFGNWSTATFDSLSLYPHNIFLETFVEQGWIVGSILLVMTFLVIARLIRRRHENPVVGLTLAILAAEVVNVSTSGDLNARSFFAFLVLGWIVAKWFPKKS